MHFDAGFPDYYCYYYLTLDSQRNSSNHYRHFCSSEEELLNVAEETQIDFHGFHQNHPQFHQNQEIPFPQNHLFHGGLAASSPKKRSRLLSSKGVEKDEYALNLPEKMAENYHHHHQQQQLHHQEEKEKASRPSRLGLRTAGGGGGEIVEVQGGHIVRSTGRKDRHSKVCTAKGPRDRRVRLSAHTAIQFYDVQDRLGYDRPSKAVDWLIKKAKTAIDELAELPAWKPTATTGTILDFEQNPDEENLNRGFDEHPDDEIADNQMGNAQDSTFLPLDSNSIANTIKSFFPMGGAPSPPPVAASNINSSDMQFHHHHFPPPELLSRPTNQNQDLNLSLQSFQDPILHHHHQPQPPHQHGGNNTMFFDGQGWPENHPGGFQRLVAWGGGGGGGGGDGVSSTGFVFGSQPLVQPPLFLQPLFGQPTNSQLFNYISQRGPLQSSNSPPVRAWVDPPQPPSFSGEYSGTFPGFHIPARIQGEDDEEHDGISDKPSSASSDSRD